MTRRIIQSEDATEDLIDIALYLRADDSAIAERFLASVNEDFRRIAEMPGIGTSRLVGTNPPIPARVWPVTAFRNYLIFYQSIENELTILRVLHGARDIDRIFEIETDGEE